MKSILHLLLVCAVALIVMFGFNSCAGSKPATESGQPAASNTGSKDYDEIERLLGIDQPSQPADTQSVKDDDLLELLKANEEANQSKTGLPAELEEPLKKMKSEVTELKAQLQEKEAENDLLKSQVSASQKETVTPPRPAVRYGSDANIGDAEYENRYHEAFDLAQNRRYREAIRAFEDLLASSTRHSLSDNAQYWIGECYYALGDYQAAIMAFEKVFTFKNSNKNDYSQYKLGLCYFKLKDRERARQEFQSLIANYKNSMLISKAQEYMSRL